MRGHRLFIAINPPADVQRELFAATELWRGLPIRWTKPEQIHITLHFIGNADDDALAHIVETLPFAAEGIERFELAFSRIGMGPEKGAARMVWAEGETPEELARLQRQAQDAAESHSHVLQNIGMNDDDAFGEINDADGAVKVYGRAHASSKPFCLHITLGRMIPFKWAQLAEKPRIEKRITASFPVSSIELMESERGQGGPAYTILSSVDLA